MEIVKIIGIIALILFVVAVIAKKAVILFVETGATQDKIVEILGYVITGSFTIAASCGLINLFA
jgi:hypothetical protein